MYDDNSGNEGYYTFRTGINGVVATLDDISSYTLSGSNASVTFNKDGTAQNTVTVNNVANATTATKLGSTTVGASNKPIYLSSGTATASTSTIGSSVKPIYMTSGTLTASSSTVGSGVKPIYLNSGTLTASATTVGSGNKLIYLNQGTITASTSTYGSSKLPVYLTYGSIAECALVYTNSPIAITATSTSGYSNQAGTVALAIGSSDSTYSGSAGYGNIDFANSMGCGYIRYGKISKTSGSKSSQNVTFYYQMKGPVARYQETAASTTYKTPSVVSVILQDGSGAVASEWSNAHRVDSCNSAGFKWSHGASEAITLYYIAIGSAY